MEVGLPTGGKLLLPTLPPQLCSRTGRQRHTGQRCASHFFIILFLTVISPTIPLFPRPPSHKTNIYRYLMEDSLFLLKILAQGQCFGSGFNQVSGSVSGSGSRREKWSTKMEKKVKSFMFWSAGCSLVRAEGFNCRLDVLYGGLGISKLQFFIKNIFTIFSCIFFSSIFGHQNPGSISGFTWNAESGFGEFASIVWLIEAIPFKFCGVCTRLCSFNFLIQELLNRVYEHLLI